jgi:hypothetical protein
MAWEVPAESNRDELPRLRRHDALGLFAPISSTSPRRNAAPVATTRRRSGCRVGLPTRSRVRSRPRSYFTCLDRLR